jgi:Flp pilus assembly protein TadD
MNRSVLALMRLAILGLTLAGCAAPQPTDHTNMDPEARMRLADAALAAGNRELAVSMYQSASGGAPNDAQLQLRCASGMARAGSVSAARDMLIGQLKTHPRDSDLLRGLAAIYVISGQTSPALSELDRALTARPNDANALLDKAVALDMQGNHAEAQRMYHQMLAQTPGDAVISNDLAVSLMIEGRTQEAQVVLAPFADSDEIPERMRINLGLIYAANGDTEAARRLLGARLGEGDIQKLAQTMVSTSRRGAGVQTP